MRKLILIAAALTMLSSFASAQWMLDKVPDRGPFWQPLGVSPATAIYANSLIYTGPNGQVLTSMGVYIRERSLSGVQGQDLRYFLLANGTNNPTGTILSTSTSDVSTNSATLVALSANMSPFSMVNGTQYWFAAQAQGNNSNVYQVGAHTQNSIYSDSGTFWFSNANDFNNWDGQARTPEMAIFVNSAVPEPASMAVLGLGFAALAARRRRRRK